MGNFKKILCVLLVAALFGGCTAAPSVITTIATTGAPTTAATTTAATTTGAITGTTTGAPTTHAPTTVAPTTVAPTTVAPTTVAPTTTTTPTTSVQKDRYLLSFAGDCTLGENYDEEGARGTYTYVVGKNYSYPMANVKHIFEADDLTFVNLECALTASEPTEEEMVELSTHRFRFRGPTDYTNILTSSSIEVASCANNHSRDYGQAGLLDTWKALDDAGVAYASFGKSRVVTTEGGLKVGVCAIFFYLTQSQIENVVTYLRGQGAEIIVMSIHWGDEGIYEPADFQQDMAHMAIDAGVDIVYGHHSHTLMPIEAYNGGIIYYSLGNFSFGGNCNPTDKDTAIIQQEVLRNPDGTVTLGNTTAIPCRVSTVDNWNDYRPTPYDPEHEGYQRALSKLSGTFLESNP